MGGKARRRQSARHTPWVDMTRLSAALAVANRLKPGRRPEFEPDDDDEPAPPRPFERHLRFAKKGAR
jgi:hypothetical protein